MMKRRPLLLMSLCNCLLLAAPAAADNPLVPARATSQQQQIKVQTQQVKDEIGAIIAEYQSNGLGASNGAMPVFFSTMPAVVVSGWWVTASRAFSGVTLP